MPNQLTNLIPAMRRQQLVREYYFRFGVVAIAVIIVLIGVGALLLIPTYVYLVGTTQEKQTRLAHITTTLSSADEVALSSRLAALSSDATALIALSKKPSVSDAVRAALGIARPGVTLSSLSFTPGAKSNSLLLTGTAVSRDALRNYQLALQSMPSAVSATLPVSVYAKDSDIPFTITITLAP